MNLYYKIIPFLLLITTFHIYSSEKKFIQAFKSSDFNITDQQFNEKINTIKIRLASLGCKGSWSPNGRYYLEIPQNALDAVSSLFREHNLCFRVKKYTALQPTPKE